MAEKRAKANDTHIHRKISFIFFKIVDFDDDCKDNFRMSALLALALSLPLSLLPSFFVITFQFTDVTHPLFNDIYENQLLSLAQNFGCKCTTVKLLHELEFK